MRNMQDFYCETVTRFLLDFGVKFNFELIVFPYRNIFNFLFTPSHSPTAWEICPGSFFFPSLQLLHLSCPLPTWTLSSSFSSPPLTSYLTLSSSFLNQAKFFKPLYPRRVCFLPSPLPSPGPQMIWPAGCEDCLSYHRSLVGPLHLRSAALPPYQTKQTR